MKKKYILVPDVHGRTFWKDILPFVDECEKIVFLGDYHDPYDDEGITEADSLLNFKKIINFVNEHKDKVVMLLGNHDLSYYNRTGDDYWDVHANRMDVSNYKEIRSIFTENSGLFSIIHKIEIPEEHRVFLLSHAGVHPLWITDNKLIDGFNQTTNASVIYSTITELFNEADRKFRYNLCDIGFTRGGYNDVGSMVWADCHEYMFNKSTPYTQIFGHTQVKEPVITGENIGIDCHKCFYIDEEGTLRDLKTDEEIY